MKRTTFKRNNMGQISDERYDKIKEDVANMLNDYFRKHKTVDFVDLEFIVHNSVGWARCLIMMEEFNSKGDEK